MTPPTNWTRSPASETDGPLHPSTITTTTTTITAGVRGLRGPRADREEGRQHPPGALLCCGESIHSTLPTINQSINQSPPSITDLLCCCCCYATRKNQQQQDDGIIKLEVLEPVSRSYTADDPMRPYTETKCVVRNKNPVTLGARKGTNIPGAVLDLPALTERDKRVRGCR